MIKLHKRKKTTQILYKEIKLFNTATKFHTEKLDYTKCSTIIS